MARYSYRGDALARPDIFQVVVNAVIPGARYGLKCWNKVLASVIGSGDEEIEDLVARFQTAVTNVGIETQPGTVANSFRIVGTPGEALGPASDSSPGCYVRLVRAGVAATNQVFRIVIPPGASGGTWGMWFKLDGDVAQSDLIAYNAVDTAVADAVNAAADELQNGTGATARLIFPGSATESRVYEVTMGGDFAGLNFDVEGDGATLLGVGAVTCSNVQLAAPFATCIQAIPIIGYTPGFPAWGNQDTGYRFTRNGVTSTMVGGILNANTNSSVAGAITAALAEICGAGAVTWTLVFPTMRGILSGDYHPGAVLVVKWNALGSQSLITGDYGRFRFPYTPAATFSATYLRESGSNQNEFVYVGGVASDGQAQQIEITQGATTFTHSGLASWETALGSGNIALTQMGVGFFVEFKGSLAALDQAAVTYKLKYAAEGSFNATVYTAPVLATGVPLTNQIDQMVIRGVGGTFTASSDGTNYTGALSANISASTLQSQLFLLTAIGSGNCAVTGLGTPASPFLIEYIGSKAATAMPQLVFNTAATLQGGADPEITGISSASPGVKQQDQIFIDPNATSGSIKPLVNGTPGSAVAWNGTATNWTTGIEAAGPGVTVTGSVGGPFFVEYDAVGIYSLTLDQSLLVVSESTLFTITQVQESTGPLNYNEPLNWSPPVVPGSEDIAAWMDSPAACQEGLRHECVFTADVATGDFRLGTNVNDCGDFVVGQKVRIATTGTFPTATISGSAHTLSAGTAYYVVSIDRFRRRMQLATSRSGVGIELTGAGTGVHTVFVRLEKLEQRRSHTGPIGRSRRLNNTWEERPRYLKLQASQVDIGAGESGSGTSLCFLDLGSFAFEADVWYTGNASSGEQALQIRLSNGSSNIHTRGGQIGIGTDDQPCVMGNLIAQSTDVTLGLVTLASIDMTGCFHAFPMGITVSGTTRISP